jgi:hypothetical protein
MTGTTAVAMIKAGMTRTTVMTEPAIASDK